MKSVVFFGDVARDKVGDGFVAGGMLALFFP